MRVIDLPLAEIKWPFTNVEVKNKDEVFGSFGSHRRYLRPDGWWNSWKREAEVWVEKHNAVFGVWWGQIKITEYKQKSPTGREGSSFYIKATSGTYILGKIK